MKFNDLAESLINERKTFKIDKLEVDRRKNSHRRKSMESLTPEMFKDGLDFLKLNGPGGGMMHQIMQMKFTVIKDFHKVSESNAAAQTIKVSERVYNETVNGKHIDDGGWIIHEICHNLGTVPFTGDYLALTNRHCEKIVAQMYQAEDVRTMNDLRKKLIRLFGKDGNGYPTADVELFTFGMQFKFLKENRNYSDSDVLNQMRRDAGYVRNWREFMPKFLFMMNPKINKIQLDHMVENFKNKIET